MKIFYLKLRILKLVTSLVVLPIISSSLNAEMINGEKDTSLYIKNFYTPKSGSKTSKTLALEGAYLACLDEFIDYSIKGNMILPDSLAHLGAELKANLYLSANYIDIFGVKKLTYGFNSEGNAVCILEVPKYNIKNFSVMDFSVNPERITSFILKNPLLRLEVAFSLNMDIESFLDSDEYFSRKIAFFRNDIELSSVPCFLLKDSVSFNKGYLKKVTDRELLNIYTTSLGQDNLLEALNSEIESRDYPMSAKYLSSLKLARGDSFYGVDALLEGAKVELSPFEKFLANNRASVKFKCSSINNEKCVEATSLYFSETPDVSKIKALLLESFSESISSDALNLYGKILEYEANYVGAALFFAQTLSIDNKHSYAKANLAIAYKSLGLEENAITLSEKILKDKNSNNYSIRKAREILKIEESLEN